MKKDTIVKQKGKEIYYRCQQGGIHSAFYCPVHPAASNQMYFFSDKDVIVQEIIKIQVHASIIMRLLNKYNAFPSVRVKKTTIDVLFDEKISKKLQNVKPHQIILLYNAVLKLRIYVITDSIENTLKKRIEEDVLYKNLTISISTHGMFGGEGIFSNADYLKSKEEYRKLQNKSTFFKIVGF